jgi:hypothetical protein
VDCWAVGIIAIQLFDIFHTRPAIVGVDPIINFDEWQQCIDWLSHTDLGYQHWVSLVAAALLN